MSPTPKRGTVKEARIKRLEQEKEYVEKLPSDKRQIIKQSLEMVESMESAWVLNLLKYSISAREDELQRKYQIGASNFESQGASWYEARWDKLEKRKLKDAITSRLPDFFREWLDIFRVKREKLRLM